MSLSASDLRVDRGSVRALDGVSLDVAGGEVVALLGANGAGKSTLLLALAGLLPHRTGRILLDGADIGRLGAAARARAGIALVPEGGGVFPTLTVADTLRLAAGSGRDARQRCDEVLDRQPRLRPLLSRIAGTLSGGERRQVAIGRALALRPAVLLTDELTLGLSPVAAAEVAEVIRSVAAGGVGILLAEQRAARALALADRGVVLQRGRVAVTGSAATLRERADDLQAVYLGGAPALRRPLSPGRGGTAGSLETLGIPLTNRQRRLLQERADSRGESVGAYVARLVDADVAGVP